MCHMYSASRLPPGEALSWGCGHTTTCACTTLQYCLPMGLHQLLSRHVLHVGFTVAATLSPFALTSVAQATPTTTTSLAPGTEATVAPLPLNTGVTGGEVSAISCTAPGQCVAGGVEYLRATVQHAVLSTETNGIWGKAQVVGMSAPAVGSSVFVEHVVCPRMGACVALGQVDSTSIASSGAQFSSFLVVQHGSNWNKAQVIPTTGLGVHPSYLLTAMACEKAGSCVMAGTLLVNGTADRVFSLTWHNGRWSAPSFLSGAALGARAKLMSLAALSCVGSWCEGIGLYTTALSTSASTGHNIGPYGVTYSGGRWHTMHSLGAYRASTNVSLLGTISCTSVGTCVAGGESDATKGNGSTAVATEERSGHWSALYALPFKGANTLETVSCTSASACTGIITHTGGNFAGVVTMSASRHWNVSTPASTPGWSSLQGWAMSCVARQCTIVGSGTQTAAGSSLPVVITPSAG